MGHPDITYVDAQDNVIGQGSMQDAWKFGHLHRVARLLVFNTKGDLLLQKRSMSHKNMPGRWDNSAAGHVDVGEDYATAALREAEEEMGIVGLEVEEVCKYFQDETEPGIQKKRWNTLFVARYDGEVHIDGHEVSEMRWINQSDLEKWMQNAPSDFTPGFLTAWRKYHMSPAK
jgi:16S rRNA (adenine1518-N6/adenine1519-N6)-dimethyltransferase